MEWWLVLLIIFGSLIMLLLSGIPVAFAFIVINLVGVYMFWGGTTGLWQLGYNLLGTTNSFIFLPMPLFILMGEIMFQTRVAPRMIDTIDKWLGELPGRLALLAVGGGTMFASLSGSSMASTAMLGSTLVPDMEKRGYGKPMSLGPILGSGGLAMMVPPSASAVFLACIAEISVGQLLIAIIFPALLMAFLYATYVIGRCWLQPSVAPSYKPVAIPLSKKVADSLKYVLPLGFIVFMVIGLIFLGVCTPSESAALGAFGSLILGSSYRTLSWSILKKAVMITTKLIAVIMIILVGATAFNQILAFSGATRGLIQFVTTLPISPIGLVIIMQGIVLIMGAFMEEMAILMLTLPIFMPIIRGLGLDPLWFGVLMLLNMEMAQTTPPFGMSLFVMKSVAPPDTTMGDIYRAGLPFIVCDAIAMGLMIAFPLIALWLPARMH